MPQSEARSRRYSVTRRPWTRPTWDEYCDVVLGYAEAELIDIFFSATRLSATNATKLLRSHMRLLVRAAAIGTAPGYRRALGPAFRSASPVVLRKLIARLSIAYAAPPATLPVRLQAIIGRAILTTALLNNADAIIIAHAERVGLV